MIEPMPQTGAARATRAYRIDRPKPCSEGGAFLLVQIGADGYETLLASCATLREAADIRSALEQLDTAEALARRARARSANP